VTKNYTDIKSRVRSKAARFCSALLSSFEFVVVSFLSHGDCFVVAHLLILCNHLVLVMMNFLF
jgi:hypothetical protein